MALFNKKTKDEKETEKVPEPSMKDLYSDTDKTNLKKVTKDNKKKEISTKKISSKNNSAYKVLIKPLVTEKAANLASKGQYVFVVSREANKIEIMKAIYSVYNIKPLSVNIINNQGKKVRRGKQTGKRKDWKKAIVSLAEGKSLNIYEGV
jgi:large subunit ribosomal protein L23